MREIFGRALVIVGHSIKCDLKALKIKCKPALQRKIEDVARMHPYNFIHGQTLGLKVMAQGYLAREIQRGKHHDSLEDAQATLALYLVAKKLVKPRSQEPEEYDDDDDGSSNNESYGDEDNEGYSDDESYDDEEGSSGESYGDDSTVEQSPN